VQLRHIPTETSWEDLVDHGYVAVYLASGKMVLRKDGFQHNRKLRAGGAYDAKAIESIVAEVKQALATEAPAKEAAAAEVPSAKADLESQVQAAATKVGASAA